MLFPRILAAGLAAATLMGCDDPAPHAPADRPVRAVTVQPSAAGETVSFTGQIRPRDQVSLAFRLDGRLLERAVEVGDTVKAGQVIARLDPQIPQNELRQAQANLSAAQGQLTEARNAFRRQQELLTNGWTTQARFDQAQQALQTAQAQVDAAQARLRTAHEHLGYTELKAEAAGSVTAVGAWPGEVVRAGQTIAEVALQAGRDAVFDVPAQILRTAPRDPVVEIALTDDPKLKATSRVREVAPQADPATRTFRVKVGIIDPPEAMRLGATVTGRIQLTALPGLEVPASALASANGNPAVWVVDPQDQTVSLRDVTVQRYDPDSVVIGQGLEGDEVVVTAGVHALRPGQKVRLLGAAQ